MWASFIDLLVNRSSSETAASRCVEAVLAAKNCSRFEENCSAQHAFRPGDRRRGRRTLLREIEIAMKPS
jgi:hypothetical protein